MQRGVGGGAAGLSGLMELSWARVKGCRSTGPVRWSRSPAGPGSTGLHEDTIPG